jgi:hypothetical protein
LVFARKLAASKYRYPDDRLAVADLLERWNLGLGTTLAERRMALRLSREQAAIDLPDTGEPEAASLPSVCRVLHPEPSLAARPVSIRPALGVCHGQSCSARLRSNHSPDAAHAQRWIFHTLTGPPPHLAHPDIAPVTGAQRQQYQRFSWRILPAEAELLMRTAHALLGEHGLDEPVRWAPHLPARALAPLRLPGPEPDSISAAQLHQAVPAGDFSIAQLAHLEDQHGACHLSAVPVPGRLEPTAVSPHSVHRHPHRAMAHLVRARPPLAPGHRGPGRNQPCHGRPGSADGRHSAAPRRVISGRPRRK